MIIGEFCFAGSIYRKERSSLEKFTIDARAVPDPTENRIPERARVRGSKQQRELGYRCSLPTAKTRNRYIIDAR